MERIRDDRMDIIMHGEAAIEDLPIDGLPELPTIGGMEPFSPATFDGPQMYPGDVLVGVMDGRISFAELIYDTIDQGIVVISLDTGRYNLVAEQEFASRFFKHDEVHVYDDVTNDVVDWDVTVDVSEIERPKTGRPR